MKDLHTLFEVLVKSGIDDRELARQLLLDSIQAYSMLAASQAASALKDVETEESIEALQSECDKLGGAVVAHLRHQNLREAG